MPALAVNGKYFTAPSMAKGNAQSLQVVEYLLDLERKAFMELLNHPKTQERIMGMMQTGKPVRN